MSVKPTAIIASADGRRRDGWDDPMRGNPSWVTLFSGDITPTNALSAGIMELKPNGGVLKAHRHRQAEIYYVAEGTGVVTIDGAVTAVAAGMAVFIPGDAEHSARNDSDVVLKIFYVFPTDCFADVVYRFSNET